MSWFPTLAVVLLPSSLSLQIKQNLPQTRKKSQDLLPTVIFLVSPLQVNGSRCIGIP